MTGKQARRRNNQKRKSNGATNTSRGTNMQGASSPGDPVQTDLQDHHPENQTDMGVAVSYVTPAFAVVCGPALPPTSRNGGPHGTLQEQILASTSQAYREHNIETVTVRPNGHYSSYEVEYETLRSELDTTKRRLAKAEADFEKLQTEKLQSIDRFQPEFDPTFISKVKSIELKINSLASFLQKHFKPDRNAEGERPFKFKLWYNQYSSQNKIHLNLGDKDLLRKALKSMIWMFLRDELFSGPFLCYGEEIGNQMSSLLNTLYKKPHHHPDSVKWRCLTVQRLEASKDPKLHQSEEVICQQLHTKFQSTVSNIGTEIKEATLFQKTQPLFEAAIKLAKLFASQRAIFEFFDPPKDFWFKEEGDSYCTNVDDANDDDDQPTEETGEISFIVSPALLKRGTGMGDHLERQIFLKKAFVQLVPKDLVGGETEPDVD